MAAAANPLALGVGAAASFAGGILSAIGSGPSKQMEALNSQIGAFSKNMTSLATQEGLGASTVFNNLMAPLQRIVQGGPQQAGWSNAQVSAYNADATNRAAATARDMGALGTGTSGNPGASNARQLAAQQAAEDARSNAIAAGEVKSADVGRENFNTAVGEETQLPGVFKIFSQVFRCVTQLLFNAEQLVVFGNPVGTASRAGFDEAGIQSNSKISNGNIFRFA